MAFYYCFRCKSFCVERSDQYWCRRCIIEDQMDRIRKAKREHGVKDVD